MGHYVKKNICKIMQHLHYELMGKVPDRSQLLEDVILLLEENLS